MVSNPDLARIINSNEVQTAIRPAKVSVVHHSQQRRNPLTNRATMEKLNPAKKIQRQAAQKAQATATEARRKALAEKRSVLTKE